MGDSQQWKPTAREAESLKSMCQGGLSLETFREGLSWLLPASDAPPPRCSLASGFKAQRVSPVILGIALHGFPSVHVCVCVQRILVVRDCTVLLGPHRHRFTSAKTFHLSHGRRFRSGYQ